MFYVSTLVQSVREFLPYCIKNLTISEAEPTLSNLFVHSFIIYCKIKKKMHTKDHKH